MGIFLIQILPRGLTVCPQRYFRGTAGVRDAFIRFLQVLSAGSRVHAVGLPSLCAREGMDQNPPLAIEEKEISGLRDTYLAEGLL